MSTFAIDKPWIEYYTSKQINISIGIEPCLRFDSKTENSMLKFTFFKCLWDLKLT